MRRLIFSVMAAAAILLVNSRLVSLRCYYNLCERDSECGEKLLAGA